MDRLMRQPSQKASGTTRNKTRDELIDVEAQQQQCERITRVAVDYVAKNLHRCELCGRRDQRAVVGMHVRHGCRLQLRQLGLQRQGARGPRGGVVHGHDGRHGVRGVELEVEQRC